MKIVVITFTINVIIPPMGVGGFIEVKKKGSKILYLYTLLRRKLSKQENPKN